MSHLLWCILPQNWSWTEQATSQYISNSLKRYLMLASSMVRSTQACLLGTCLLTVHLGVPGAKLVNANHWQSLLHSVDKFLKTGKAPVNFKCKRVYGGWAVVKRAVVLRFSKDQLLYSCRVHIQGST